MSLAGVRARGHSDLVNHEEFLVATQLVSPPPSVATRSVEPLVRGLARPLPEGITPQEALRQADLDFRVVAKPLYRRGPDSDNYEVVDGHVLATRDDTGAALGIVGRGVVPIQNRDQASLVEIIMAESGAQLDSLVSLHGGRRQAWTLRLPGQLVVGDDDTSEMFLLLVNGHSSDLALRMLTSAVRLACLNQLPVALRRAKSSVVMRHTSGIQARVQDVRRLVGQVLQHFADLEETMDELASVDVDDDDVRRFLARVVPLPAKASPRQRNHVEERRRLILENFASAPGSELAGRTPWGLVNACTHFATHQRKFRGEDSRRRAEARFESLALAGEAQRFTQRALDEACRLLQSD